jgi:hypothetical protein
MQEEEKNIITVRCPECLEDTSINLSKNLKCKHCEKPLTNSRYIKPLIKGTSIFTTAILIGIGSGIGIDEFFEKDRYPISVEYSIIERSLSGDSTPISRGWFKSKKEICFEALERTQKKISYKEYQEEPLKFMDEYEKQLFKK